MAGAPVAVRSVGRPGSLEDHLRLNNNLLVDDFELVRQKLAAAVALPLTFIASELKAYKITAL